MQNNSSQHICKKGGALLAVLWSALIISGVIMGSIFVIKSNMEISSEEQNQFDAELLAQRGFALAQHPEIQRNDPILRQKNAHSEYRVKIINEDGRLHLNALLLKGHGKIVRKLFIHWGMDLQTSSAFVDALKDWVDIDDFTHLNGAEFEEYEALGKVGLPFNKPFASLNEVRLVLGFAELERVKAEWRDYFTLWGSGRIDLTAARADVILASSGASEEKVESFLDLLKGQDGIRYTEDDLKLANVEEALILLDLEGGEFEILRNIFSVKSDIIRAESFGRIFKSGVLISAVYRRVGFGKELFYYKSRRFDLE